MKTRAGIIMAIPRPRTLRDWILFQKPPTLALAMSAAGLLADASGPRWLRFGSSGLGALLVLFGVTLLVWGNETFRRYRTPVPHRLRPTELVESGPYRISRNPMYLGMGLAMFGVALGWGGVASLAAAATWMWLMNTIHIPAEEARMAEAFGGRWRAYAHRIRRWL